MTTLKKFRANLKYVAGLLGILGFLISGTFTHLYAATSSISPLDITAVQDLTVTGTVTASEDGMPIPGANVIIKGTTTGTTTDFDGNFSIKVASSNSVLVFSSIGFAKQEVTVGNNTTINVALDMDVSALEEVVVVGFGTQKKATLTGSVTQVKGDDIMKGKGTSNAALALQGEVPGVVVTRTSSRPGNEGTNIKIRGDISVNNIGPLILLDGLEIPEWQLATLNANDIESYSVLKDGAAAIYGTKAAGGVILVTTKKGKQGKMKVNYKGETQMNIPHDFPTANLQEWAQLWLRAGDNDGISYVDTDGITQQAAPNYRFFTRDELVSIVDGTLPMAPDSYFWLTKEHRFDDVNQFDAVYGSTLSQRHDLSVSGGSENATYRSSIGYANERSPISFVYDGAKKYNFRTNLTYQMSDMVKTELTVSYDNRLVDEPTQGVGHGVQDMYLFPLYNPQGQYYDIFGANNLLAKLDEGGRIRNKEEIFRLGGVVTLNLDKYVNGLSLKYNGNFSSRNGRKTERTTSVTMYDWEGNISYTPTTLLTSGVKIYETEIMFQNHVIQANYNKSFGKHNIGFLLGLTAEEEQSYKYFQSRSNMASDELDDINTGDVTTQVNGGSPKDANGNTFNSGSNAVGLVSYISKLNYDYNGIYLLEVLGRRDGSSRLHPDYRWKNFYSASAGIRLSEMAFMKDGFFNNLKLRASYGETGSVTGIGAYDYISNITVGTTIFGASPALANTARIASLTSTERTWERVATTNFGIDFSILNSRLSGNAEYFTRKNNDMLIPITYPQILGASAPKTNSGDFKTNGWEIALNWRDQIGELKYNIGVMAWDSESEVTRMEGATAIKLGVNKSSGSDANIIEGKPLNAIYTYKTDGYLQTEEQVLNYYNQYGFVDPANQLEMKPGTVLPNYRSADRLVPGTVNRIDVNEDGVINEDDLVYFGDANPHKSYGINLGLEYKGFDFSAFFQGVGKQNIVREGALAYPFRSWWTNQNSAFLGTTWTEDNPNAENPASFYNGQRKNWNYGHINDINVIKASYLRAKVLTLGYSLPQDVLAKSGLERVRLSVTGNDLFVISNVKDGMDPEMGSSANQGNTVPYTSTVLLGLEVTF
ncbi:SusC/RagA family TonB-linked outer membrane protein [Zobellia galactanivorans]|uniref:TonB-dependent Receptor n=1 Tax=Zobellia galactanivorans (strain DSM 12802 / CCUG 47099 / CIP 106680 / NCIMB 13871 / Dsij) TaxID=63186 RepID=G0L8H8_ZOBGA|nr:SusC/RagA family TonB-linked outer membrane protein [Zobellia galactanivorans]CAZ97579.1 TonB-dependent Receptor [Zobellia galactanivorans]